MRRQETDNIKHADRLYHTIYIVYHAMLILGIESSCDDTSVALVDCSENGHVIISQKTASQIDIHKKYGGVVPEIAGRMHAEKIVPLVEEVLSTSSPYQGEARRGSPSSALPRDGGNIALAQNTANHPYPSLVTADEAGSRCGGKRRGIARPDAIAVTAGPGLVTGLIVGVEAARTLSYLWNVPAVAVNHIEGHIHSVEIPNDKLQMTNNDSPPPSPIRRGAGGEVSNAKTQKNIIFPALALVVSGGHTELVLMKDHGDYTILGKTKDDAAGECFDKVAKLLGLPYPGGPEISKLAATGRVDAIDFPRPMLARRSLGGGGLDQDNYDFSFAGLKTSALYWLRDHNLTSVILNTSPRRGSDGSKRSNSPATAGSRLSEMKGGAGFVASRPQNDNSRITLNDFAASFEQAIVDVLVTKTLRAAQECQPKSIILCGGVSANKKLRETLKKEIEGLPSQGVYQYAPTSYLLPATNYSMDNAAMIAIAGYYHALKKDFTPWDQLDVDPNWKVDSPLLTKEG